MTVSTTCIANFCIVTVVLCKLLTFELATYIELECSYTPIKPSFSRVTRCGCVYHSFTLSSRSWQDCFCLCECFSHESAILTALLTLWQSWRLGRLFQSDKGQCSKCQVFYLFYGRKSTLSSLIVFVFHSTADAALTVSFEANSFIHLTSVW